MLLVCAVGPDGNIIKLKMLIEMKADQSSRYAAYHGRLITEVFQLVSWHADCSLTIVCVLNTYTHVSIKSHVVNIITHSVHSNACVVPINQ